MAPRATTQSPAEQAVAAEETASASSPSAASRKQYNIILRIRHPELDPSEVTAALGWEPQRSWKAGDPVVTPKGTRLPGVRSDGVWSCNFKYQGNVRIAKKLDQILGHLSKHESVFRDLDRRGVATSLYIQLPGDTNMGARIPWQMLKKLADLKIAFEFEIFPEWA